MTDCTPKKVNELSVGPHQRLDLTGITLTSVPPPISDEFESGLIIKIPTLEWTEWSRFNPHAFDTKSHRNVGPGEDRFAWEIGGTVHGAAAGTYDLVDPAGNKWEVKKIKTRRSTFRGGEQGRAAASKSRDRIQRVCDLLVKGVQSIDVEVLARTVSHADVTVPQILSFIAKDIPAISKGELAKGRILGNTHANPVGLLQVLHAIEHAIRGAKKKCIRDLSIIYARKIRKIDIETYVRIGRALGMDYAEMGIDPRVYMACMFDHRAFTDPDRFIKDVWYRSIRPSIVLGHVSNLALVRSGEYYVIPQSHLDDQLELVTVTKGDVKLRMIKAEKK